MGLEQYTRRNSCRVLGIPLQTNEKPASILKKIIDECGRMKLNLKPWEFDRAHRIGKQYRYNGRLCQAVIVKFVSWDARNVVYEARGKSKFNWNPDLTAERMHTLKFAREQTEEMKFIDFVFADRNCTLMLKTSDGRFFSFSNEIEFMTLACRIEAGFEDEQRYDRKYSDHLMSFNPEEIAENAEHEEINEEAHTDTDSEDHSDAPENPGQATTSFRKPPQ